MFRVLIRYRGDLRLKPAADIPAIWFLLCLGMGTFAGLAQTDSEFQAAQSRSIAATPSPDIPDYVKPIDDSFVFDVLSKADKPDWLLFGVEHRNRLQHRDQNYRSDEINSQLLLLGRTLIYGGITDVMDPLRLHFEAINSRDIGGDAPPSSRNLNYLDIQQFHAELLLPDQLYFEDLSLKAGRMSFDFVDRRLIARNRFRNTINNFDGLRLTASTDIFNGRPSPIEVFALRPVDLHFTGFDQTSDTQFLFGAGARDIHWHELHLEPYWILLTDRSGTGSYAGLHTAGLHVFGTGVESESGFLDFDADFAIQSGRDANNQDVSAWAAHLEIAYNFDTSWKPRAALWFNASSGDHSSNSSNGTSNAFNSLFGATYGFFGFTSFFNWENVLNPAIHLRVHPRKGHRLETIYRLYWLQNGDAGWSRANRQPTPGNNNPFVGTELDIRYIMRMTRLSSLESGMAFFFPGEYVKSTGPAPLGSFFYTAITLKL